ncbi:Uncharacterized protein Rs2_17571 [Raphanus sativus]|nr:Uncharacterized protein Rs2_41317 [Raphanus sativus]KAJ4903620.1 Uncharacterized protein Rs2_17571 [Raphanus sativus]
MVVRAASWSSSSVLSNLQCGVWWWVRLRVELGNSDYPDLGFVSEADLAFLELSLLGLRRLRCVLRRWLRGGLLVTMVETSVCSPTFPVARVVCGFPCVSFTAQILVALTVVACTRAISFSIISTVWFLAKQLLPVRMCYLEW